MPQYIRAFVPGGKFFFNGRQRQPFTIEAIVILPDHLHCIWTLPSGDADCSTRWHDINPVKHGHVTRVADWPYSSFHRFVERGIYKLDWAADDKVRSLEME